MITCELKDHMIIDYQLKFITIAFTIANIRPTAIRGKPTLLFWYRTKQRLTVGCNYTVMFNSVTSDLPQPSVRLLVPTSLPRVWRMLIPPTCNIVLKSVTLICCVLEIPRKVLCKVSIGHLISHRVSVVSAGVHDLPNVYHCRIVIIPDFWSVFRPPSQRDHSDLGLCIILKCANSLTLTLHFSAILRWHLNRWWDSDEAPPSEVVSW